MALLQHSQEVYQHPQGSSAELEVEDAVVVAVLVAEVNEVI